MNKDKAIALKCGDTVTDSVGTTFSFIELDEDCDLVVECLEAINGRIVLSRAACLPVSDEVQS